MRLQKGEDIYIIGAGGHGQVVADAFLSLGIVPAGFLDDNPYLNEVMRIPVVGSIESAKTLKGKFVIAIGDNKMREKIAKTLDFPDNRYLTLIHPSSIIGKDVVIGAGSMIIGGTVINTGTKIGRHTIINTSSSIDHHNIIGDFVHIAPGTHTGGNVKIEEGAFLGIGTSIIPGVKIGKWAKIGAGAVVIKDIPEHTTSVGVPAKIIKENKNENTPFKTMDHRG